MFAALAQTLNAVDRLSPEQCLVAFVLQGEPFGKAEPRISEVPRRATCCESGPVVHVVGRNKLDQTKKVRNFTP